MTSLEWNPDVDAHTTMAKSCDLDETFFEKEFENDETQTMPVSIRTQDMHWFYRNRNNFVAFSTIISDMPNSVLTSEFVECVLLQNWEAQQKHIARHYFSVYILYAICSICYMKMALKSSASDDESPSAAIILSAVVTLALWVRQTYLEVRQAISEGLGYINFWNMIDFSGLILVFLILLMTSTKVAIMPVESQRIVAAFACCFTLIKLFDWLRLYEDTGFYVRLVQVTIYDVRFFLLLLFATLMMFGFPVLMIDGNSKQDKELIEGVFSFWLVDLLYN